MATTLYPSTTNAAVSVGHRKSFYRLTTSRGAATTSATCDNAAGYGFIDGPFGDFPAYDGWLSSAFTTAITISGTITVKTWAYQSATTTDGRLKVVVYRVEPDGTEKEFGSAVAATELGTTTALYTLSITPTSTQFGVGDRFLTRYFVAPLDGALVAGSGTATLRLDSPTADVDGDTSVELTETVNFTGTTPSLYTYYFTANPSDVSGSGNYLLNFKSSLSAASFVTTKADPEAQATVTAGGTPAQWYTPPLAPTTIPAGFIRSSITGVSSVSETSLVIDIYKTNTYGGDAVLVGSGLSSSDYGTTSANVAFNIPVPNIYIAAGERLKVVLYPSAYTVGTLSTGTFTLTLEGTPNTSSLILDTPLEVLESIQDEIPSAINPGLEVVVPSPPEVTLSSTVAEQISVSYVKPTYNGESSSTTYEVNASRPLILNGDFVQGATRWDTFWTAAGVSYDWNGDVVRATSSSDNQNSVLRSRSFAAHSACSATDIMRFTGRVRTNSTVNAPFLDVVTSPNAGQATYFGTGAVSNIKNIPNGNSQSWVEFSVDIPVPSGHAYYTPYFRIQLDTDEWVEWDDLNFTHFTTAGWVSMGTTSPYTLTGLTAGARYDVVVRASNIAGKSVPSQTKNIRVENVLARTLTASGTTNVSSVSVTLPTWSAGKTGTIFVYTTQPTNGNSITTPPAGYTQIANQIGNSATRIYVWYKDMADGDSGTAVAPGWSGSGRVSTGIFVVLNEKYQEVQPYGASDGSSVYNPRSAPAWATNARPVRLTNFGIVRTGDAAGTDVPLTNPTPGYNNFTAVTTGSTTSTNGGTWTTDYFPSPDLTANPQYSVESTRAFSISYATVSVTTIPVGEGYVEVFAQAALTATSTLTVDATVSTGSNEVFAAVALTATGTLTTGATKTTFGATALTASGTLTANAVRTTFAQAALAAAGTLTTGATRVTFAAASLSATATLTSDPTVTSGSVNATFVTQAESASGTYGSGTYGSGLYGSGSGGGSVTTATGNSASFVATNVVNAAVSLTATATLTTDATRAALGAAALTAAGTLTANAVKTTFASAALTATGTLTTAGFKTTFAAASLIATGTLTSNAAPEKFGAATLAAVATLTAAAVRSALAAAALSSTGTLTVDGFKTTFAQASLVSTAALTVAVFKATFAALALSATGTLTSDANAWRLGAFIPDALLVSTGVTGTVSNIQDSPDTPDANALVGTGGAVNVRMSFTGHGQILRTQTGDQMLRVVVSKS